MYGISADTIIAYTLGGYILCADCIDSKKDDMDSPIFISDELADCSHCDNCLIKINE